MIRHCAIFLVFKLIFLGGFFSPNIKNRPLVLYIKLMVIPLPKILKNYKEEFCNFVIHFSLFNLTVHFFKKGAFVFECPKMALGLFF